MALEDLLQLLSKHQEVEAKQAEVIRIVTLAAAYSLSSGEATPGDPEFAAAAARAEALALRMIRGAAESLEKFARIAAEYVAAPEGGEVLAAALRRQADSASALAASAGECAAFMRLVGALPAGAAAPDVPSDSDSDSGVAAARPATASRPRRPNSKYFGPEWAD
ncbi:unnamed protein product [Urochloa humidicola]